MFLLAGQGGEKLDVARTPETETGIHSNIYSYTYMYVHRRIHVDMCGEREREGKKREIEREAD